MAESTLRQEQDLQKRRSTRIVQAVPLTVTGVDALGRPFQERTSTLIINCHGCRYQSKHYVLKNMWVTIEVPHNESGREPRSVRGRITWIQRPRTVRELFQIGLELEVPGNVWGIAFPPADWFPFPESAPKAKIEIPAPSEALGSAAAEPEWKAEEAPSERSAEPEETKLRVVPPTASAEASAQLNRHMARLLTEAKLQIQSAARESATHAVASETRPLLAALQTQLTVAAEKSAAAAVSAQLASQQQELQQLLQSEREANLKSMLAEISREIEQRTRESRQKLDQELAEAETARRQEFEQQIQRQLQQAIEKFKNLSSGLGTDKEEVQLALDQLRQTSEQSAADEARRWQEELERRSADTHARVAQMDQAAKNLQEQIATATSIAEARWRGLLEADVAAASARWHDKKEASIENAVRQVNERLGETTEELTQRVVDQVQQRINAIGEARSQITAEAETALNALRNTSNEEKARSEAVMAEFRQIAPELESKRREFSSTLQSVCEAWARRGAAILDSQGQEMSRRVDETIAGVAGKLQPLLEASGHEIAERLTGEFEQQLAPKIAAAMELLSKIEAGRSEEEEALAAHQQRIWEVADRNLQETAVGAKEIVKRLTGEFEQQLGPKIAGAMELLSKIEAGRSEEEETLAAHQQRIWEITDRNLQETASRAKEILAQMEKDYGESARAASIRWISELESKAAETSHGTFESLFKSAEWYEKKVQKQMQTSLEKGMDQISIRLREKAAEMSGLFASELDHYSRSYVEHTRGQMQESAKDAIEQGARQIAETSNVAAAGFTEQTAQIASKQLELYAAKTKDALEQSTAYMEANATQVRAKLESDARAFAVEFQRALSHHAQQTLTLGKQELTAQIDQAKANFFLQSQGLEKQLQAAIKSMGTAAMDGHKERLETASNSWLLTTVTKLHQQSENIIEQMVDETKNQLKVVCNSVFIDLGEALRERLAGLAEPFNPPASPPPPATFVEKRQ